MKIILKIVQYFYIDFILRRSIIHSQFDCVINNWWHIKFDKNLWSKAVLRLSNFLLAKTTVFYARILYQVNV